jgi:hypothetical protein
MAPSLPKLPAILLANDLIDGDIVVRAPQGWSRNPADARIVHGIEEAQALDAEGQAAMARNEVVDAYLVEVEIGADGRATPRHFRERFRVLGPSIRPDLGKQADFGVGRSDND